MSQTEPEIIEGLESKSVGVRPYLPEGTQIILADGLYVAFDQGNFVLSFVQLEHPLVLDKDQAAEIKEVKSRCVGRFAVSPERFASMSKVMQLQLDRLAKLQGQNDSQEGK